MAVSIRVTAWASTHHGTARPPSSSSTAPGATPTGVTVNAVANQVPELISHLVYGSAFCPTRHASVTQLMATPEASTSSLFRLTAVQTPPELGVNPGQLALG